MAENEQQTVETKPQEEEFVLTPEIMAYENRRTDLILAGGVVLLAFFLGAFKDDSADLWLRVRSGQLISEAFPGVPRQDSFTYTSEGKPWVNPSWLFDGALYQLYARFGDSAVVAIKAVLCGLVAFVLLGVRHSGPTLWGALIAAAAALLAMSRRLAVGPEVPSFVLLALLLLVWHYAKYMGKFRLIYFAVPITVLWAQIDLTYVLAPHFLLLVCIGELIEQFVPDSFCNAARRLTKPQLTTLFVVTIICGFAGAVTPYGISSLVLPYQWFWSVLPKVPAFSRLSFEWHSLDLTAYLDNVFAGRVQYWSGYVWLALVVLGIGSFFLNYNQLSASRLLTSILAILLPFVAVRLLAPSAMILACALSLNAQEFFLANWGTDTRISRGWVIWSQAGRAVTIIALFLCIPAAFTGRVQGFVGRFGFDFMEDRYMVDAAHWLEETNPKGNGFSFLDRLSSYRTWATPERKNFADSRWHLFGDAMAKFSDARQALAKNEPAKWKPILDEYKVTHILIDPRELLFDQYRPMFESPLLAPVFISDQAIIFARTDDTIDKNLFAKGTIDTNRFVFRESHPPAKQTDRYVIPPGIIDWIWRSRDVTPTGVVSGALFTSGFSAFQRPGAEYMAIRHLRNAVASSPDNPQGHLQLGLAYRQLFFSEADAYMTEQYRLYQEQRKKQQAAAPAQAAAAKTAEVRPAEKVGETKPALPAAAKAVGPTGPKVAVEAPIASPAPGTVGSTPSAASPDDELSLPVPRPIELLAIRHYQLMTCGQNAVAAGKSSWTAHMFLFELCRESGFLDLALHHLEQALEIMPTLMADSVRQQYLASMQLSVDERMEFYKNAVQQRQEELTQAGLNSDQPVERSQMALQFSLPKLAMEEFELASPFAQETMQAAPYAANLYLTLGLPEKAQEHLQAAQRQGQMQAGEWERLMAHVHLINGNYERSRELLEHAIAEVRTTKARRMLESLDYRLRGSGLLGFREEVNGQFEDIVREANYFFNLGLLRIEMGEAKLAIDAFTKCLELSPRFAHRSIIEMYWKLISDTKPPAEPAPFDPETTVAVRFEPAEPEKAPGEKAGDAKPADKDKPAGGKPADAKAATISTPPAKEADKHKSDGTTKNQSPAKTADSKAKAADPKASPETPKSAKAADSGSASKKAAE